jgi:chloramphenicol O-acetyltransferase type B
MHIASIGKYTYGLHTSSVKSWGEGAKLYVGAFCSISDRMVVYLGGNHRHDWVTTFPFGHIHQGIFNGFNGAGHPHTNGDVRIGNDVWIGGGVTLMSGITIGDGAVVAANSHVVKDVPPYAIVGGNPTKVIRYRFTEAQIEKLLQIKWWNWDDAKLNAHLPLLCSPNIDDFIKAVLPEEQKPQDIPKTTENVALNISYSF